MSTKGEGGGSWNVNSTKYKSYEVKVSTREEGQQKPKFVNVIYEPPLRYFFIKILICDPLVFTGYFISVTQFWIHHAKWFEICCYFQRSTMPYWKVAANFKLYGAKQQKLCYWNKSTNNST